MLRLAGVERSFERLGSVCESAARALSSSSGLSVGATPKRDVGSGGSMAGRKNMKVQGGPSVANLGLVDFDICVPPFYMLSSPAASAKFPSG